MPQAKERSSPGLAIQLTSSSTKSFYSPGSTLSGNITFDTPPETSTSIGLVSVSFYGRVKVFFARSHGHGETLHRSRAALFQQTQTLYEGRHTHKPGSSFSWPFEFDVPTHPDELCLKAGKQWKPREPFLSVEDVYGIASHGLPPSFSFRKLGFGYRWHAYVEYVLKVSVTEAEGTRLLLGPKTRTSTLPIRIYTPPDSIDPAQQPRHPFPGVSFQIPESLMPNASMTEKSMSASAAAASSSDTVTRTRTNTSAHAPSMGRRDSHAPNYPHRMVGQTTTHTVKTVQLLPEYQDGNVKLSLRQRAKSVFNSSDLPRFTFDITVSRSDTLQVYDKNPNGIPFLVSVVPSSDPDKTTISSSAFPAVRIMNLSVTVRARTHIRFVGFGEERPSTSYDVKVLDRRPVDHVIHLSPSYSSLPTRHPSTSAATSIFSAVTSASTTVSSGSNDLADGHNRRSSHIDSSGRGKGGGEGDGDGDESRTRRFSHSIHPSFTDPSSPLDLSALSHPGSRLGSGDGNNQAGHSKTSATLTGSKLGRQVESPLVPSFNSYCIARTYEVKWALELGIAGQTVVVDNNSSNHSFGIGDDHRTGRKDTNVLVIGPDTDVAEKVMADLPIVTVGEDDDDDDDDEKDSEGGSSKKTSKGKPSWMKEGSAKESKAAEAAAERERGREGLRSSEDEDDDGGQLPQYTASFGDGPAEANSHADTNRDRNHTGREGEDGEALPGYQA